MRYVAIIIALFVTACGNPGPSAPCPDRTVDSLRIVELTLEKQAIIEENRAVYDSVIIFKKMNDSLSGELFINRYKVEKVRFYLAICQRDRTQDKFLKGWVTRAVE